MIRISLSFYDKLRWFLRPKFIRSQMLYKSKSKMWMAPIYEFSFGPFVFDFTFYSKRKEYHSSFDEHECEAEPLQDRVNELEEAIRTHRDQVGETLSMYVDRKLWGVLKDK